MSRAVSRGALPAVVADLVRPLPRFPLALALTLAVRRLAWRRPELFERLGALATRTVAVVPTDLPIAFLVAPAGERATVEVVHPDQAVDAAARIRAPLLVLLGLLDGTYDGDALFFSRDLVIDGETEAVVALRNALDDAELTPAELLGLKGTLGRLVERAVGEGLGAARRFAGAPEASTPVWER